MAAKKLLAAGLMLLISWSPGPSGAGAEPDAPEPAAEAPAAQPASVRITSSFDVRYAGAVLRQVARLMHEGFVRRDAERLTREIDGLPADQSRHWDFTVTYRHGAYPLQVRARLDDFGMLDLDFFCPQPLAGAVRHSVDGYLNSHGL